MKNFRKLALESFILLSALLSFFCYKPCHASWIDVGALGGYGYSSTNGYTSSNYAVGARGTYSFLPFIRLGLEWTYQVTTPSSPPNTGWTSNLAFILATFDYSLDYLLSNLFVGVKGGAVLVAAGGTNAATYALGAEAGWDYEILGPLTIGPEVSILFTGAPGLSNTATATVFQALAAVKYHLF